MSSRKDWVFVKVMFCDHLTSVRAPLPAVISETMESERVPETVTFTSPLAATTPVVEVSGKGSAS